MIVCSCNVFTDQDVRSVVEAEPTRSMARFMVVSAAERSAALPGHHPPHHQRGARRRPHGILQWLRAALTVKLMLMAHFRGRK